MAGIVNLDTCLLKKTVIGFFCLFVCFLPVMSGCGKKAPPRPPKQLPLPAITDLKHHIIDDQVKLTWTIPASEKKIQDALKGVYVYRRKKNYMESDCIKCPRSFKKVARLSMNDPMHYTESLDQGFRYTYKVVLYAGRGRNGPDSNMIDFMY